MRHILLNSFFFILCLSVHTNAATYTVTNTNDNGPGSLRAAVLDTNSTADNDVIVFSVPGCPNGICTIVLTSGELVIDATNSAGSVTISNPSGPANLIISGNTTSRIFNIGGGANVAIDGLILEEGRSLNGGAIFNGGKLTVSNSVIQNSTSTCEGGGGIYNVGDLVVTGSTIRGNTTILIPSNPCWISDWGVAEGGGGIFNISGSVVVTGSEIVQNNAVVGGGDGGGIYSNDGPVLVRDSTIANNTGYFGGGIALYAWSKYSWTAVMANCTLSGNVAYAAGGIYLNSGMVPIRITNSTITMNSADVTGGAVFGDGLGGGNMFLRNSIIAANTAGSHPDIDDRFTIVNNLGNNIIGGALSLGPLANNGGPTRTHALLPGSPAIDGGNNCVLTANGCGDNNLALPADQRGIDRVGTVDIGAFESNSSQYQLSGRVTTPDGRGLRNALVSLTDSSGVRRTVMTSSFGYYVLDNVAGGQTYTLGVASKLYRFAPQTLQINGNLTGIDFIGQE